MTFREPHSPTETSIDDLDADSEFEAAVTEIIPFLRCQAFSLAKRRELGEDMAQGALAKAWRSRRSFKPGTNLKAWLFTILRNDFYSHQRIAWRQLPWDPEAFETASTTSDDQHWAAELSDAVRLMKELPDCQREALILVGVGGFSYEDAAVLLRTPVGTVKSRVARGRLALKRSLEEKNSGSLKPRPPKGNAMEEIFVQLSQLSGAGAPRSGARTAFAA
jgi:RNA polymerase sigma-70 factor (ECF subfamily)